jgi:hypothetical protein
MYDRETAPTELFAKLQVYDVNFGTTKYEHSLLRKYFLKTAVSDRVDFLGFMVPLFRKPFSNGRFSNI